jgi:dTMP kinase
MEARLIAFCGLDGSGKSTQIELLKTTLEGRGKNCKVFKQPTSWFRQHPVVRRRLDQSDDSTDLRFISLLSAADRLLQQTSMVIPSLTEGSIVLMDRYVYSAYAYMHARGLHDAEWLVEINKFAIHPDRVIYLDVPPEVAFERILARDGESSKREEQNVELMRRVRDRYLELVRRYQFFMIEGTLEIETIQKAIAAYVDG